jgi:hypothetical protein
VPDYRFVVNVRSDTFAEPFRESIPTPAYLLAADHATPGMRDLASGGRDQGLDLFADNGNFDLIGEGGDALSRPGLVGLAGLAARVNLASSGPIRYRAVGPDSDVSQVRTAR